MSNFSIFIDWLILRLNANGILTIVQWQFLQVYIRALLRERCEIRMKECCHNYLGGFQGTHIHIYTSCVYTGHFTHMYARRARTDHYSFAHTFLTHFSCPWYHFEQRDYRLIYDNISRLSFYLVDCKTFPIL